MVCYRMVVVLLLLLLILLLLILLLLLLLRCGAHDNDAVVLCGDDALIAHRDALRSAIAQRREGRLWQSENEVCV